ncbi:SAM-dependent methyltransferase [Candidatus Termititenax persephonae]|uniref:SAM-dependent methyltransferase n=1 Tax=Candidatus Termititenax persephonae TaxID=2218525 RepID=A0A388TK95_9BACT|nr:SAM-dependent methyltransferase [Candidatus Termititenax persephonae]
MPERVKISHGEAGMGKKITDYSDYDYKKNFWEKGDRRYEDFCDHLAAGKLLPGYGEKFADICGGFGRLSDVYLPRFTDCTLFDYAPNLLALAKKTQGAKLKTVQGSVYELPFADGELDALLCVRAAHHFVDFPAAVAEMARVLRPRGRAVIEAANKRNVLEILRWLTGRSKMEPFSLQPTSRNDQGFYNYHPRYVERIFRQNNLQIKKVLGVSSFRAGFLKKICGPAPLCLAERLAQGSAGRLRLSPSLYYLLEKTEKSTSNA